MQSILYKCLLIICFFFLNFIQNQILFKIFFRGTCSLSFILSLKCKQIEQEDFKALKVLILNNLMYTWLQQRCHRKKNRKEKEEDLK